MNDITQEDLSNKDFQQFWFPFKAQVHKQLSYYGHFLATGIKENYGPKDKAVSPTVTDTAQKKLVSRTDEIFNMWAPPITYGEMACRYAGKMSYNVLRSYSILTQKQKVYFVLCHQRWLGSSIVRKHWKIQKYLNTLSRNEENKGK